MRVIMMFLSLMTIPAAASTVHHKQPCSPYKVYAPEHYIPGRDQQLQNTNS